MCFLSLEDGESKVVGFLRGFKVMLTLVGTVVYLANLGHSATARLSSPTEPSSDVISGDWSTSSYKVWVFFLKKLLI